MECLTSAFFYFLQERELALLLCSRASNERNECDIQNHSTFMLMAQEFPKAMHQPPNTGILFRYAHANQLLAEANPARPHAAFSSELAAQYADYIEQALGVLHCDTINPLDRDALSPTISDKSTMTHSIQGSDHREHFGDIIFNSETQSFIPELANEDDNRAQTGDTTMSDDVRNTDQVKMSSGVVFQSDGTLTKNIGVGPENSFDNSETPDNLVCRDRLFDADDVWNDSSGVGSCNHQITKENPSMDDDTVDGKYSQLFDYAT